MQQFRYCMNNDVMYFCGIQALALLLGTIAVVYQELVRENRTAAVIGYANL